MHARELCRRPHPPFCTSWSAATALFALFGCGARTGLQSPDDARSTTNVVDGETPPPDAIARPDGSDLDAFDGDLDALDAGVDALDAGVDATPDARPPRDALADAVAEASLDAGTASVRPIAPLSTATVTSTHPTLRWALGAGETGARVELCRDRAMGAACVAPQDALGTSLRLATPLAPGVWFWRLRARGGVGPAGPVWEFVVGARDAPVDTSWGTFSDLDGDGRADVLVGAVDATTLYGYRGLPARGTPDFMLTGPAASTNTQHLLCVGDVNGDGFPDVVTVVGVAPAGRATTLYFGGPAGLATSVPIVPPAGSHAEFFGSRVAAAGDLDGDGYADLVTTDEFALYVYAGGPDGLRASPPVPLPVATLEYLAEIAGVGDVNGDGYGDVALDNPMRDGAGFVWLYAGGADGLPAVPTRRLEVPDDYIEGLGLAGANDVDGDGYADLVVVIEHPDDSDALLLYRGGAMGVAASPTNPLAIDAFNNALSGVGDVDVDGFADLTFTVRWPTARTLLLRGSPTGFVPAPVPLDAPPGLHGEVSFPDGRAGDIDGNGAPDVVAADSDGHVWLFLGGAGPFGATPAVTLTAPPGGSARFGVPLS